MQSIECAESSVEPASSDIAEFRPNRRRWYARKALLLFAWTCLLEGLIAVVVAVAGAAHTDGPAPREWWGLLVLDD
jgi:hypothetical protein